MKIIIKEGKTHFNENDDINIVSMSFTYIIYTKQIDVFSLKMMKVMVNLMMKIHLVTVRVDSLNIFKKH